MCNTHGDGVEDIGMSREEYVSLKRHLAEIRGYEVAMPQGVRCPFGDDIPVSCGS